jgi:RNA polymerase sigma factor (sigma-70 family)
MNDRVLVEALRTRDPGAVGALYDAYAEGLYRYCWSLLRSADSAQAALRDTLIAAQAHAGALSQPRRLRAWLYALARAECLRRRAAAPPGDVAVLAEAPPTDAAVDADLRVMAWNAVQSLPVADRDVLELSIRHEFPDAELARVLAVRVRRVQPLLEAARDRLRDAITAEILARKGPYDCPRRAAILSGFSGELTPEMRENLITHLPQCETCAPHRSRHVSATKVFELLPHAQPPESLRIRVMSCFTDPELVPYRRYVAKRTGVLGAAGFPVPGGRAVRRWPQVLASALAAVATMMTMAVIGHQLGEKGGLPGAPAGASPTTGESPAVRPPWRGAPDDGPLAVEPMLNSTGTHLVRATGAPVTPAHIPAYSPPGTTPATPAGTAPASPSGTPAGAPPWDRPPTAGPPDRAPVEIPQWGHPAQPPSGRPGPWRPTPGTRTPCPTPTPSPTSTPTPAATPTPTPTSTAPPPDATPSAGEPSTTPTTSG